MQVTAVHDAEPAVEDWPTGQAVQEEAFSAEYVFAGQSAHEEAPVVAAYLPAVQLVHEVDAVPPVEAFDVPAGQGDGAAEFAWQ